MPAENTVDPEQHRGHTWLPSRRALLKRLLYTGLAGSAALVSLESCSLPGPSPRTIKWLSNGDYRVSRHASNHNLKGTFNQLANYFSDINQDNITVEQEYVKDHSQLVDIAKGHNPEYDIISLDVTWMREFIGRGLLEPLDQYWPEDSQSLKRSDYLPVPLQICSLDTTVAGVKGKLWAAPLHTDVGLLYYRTDRPDIIDANESKKWTWDDLERMAQHAQQSGWCSGGYLWEASSSGIDGLICTFLEILDGFGGQLFDNPNNPREVRVNSSESVMALQRMRKWNTSISAYDIGGGALEKATDSNGDQCAGEWLHGHAAFLRSWPDAINWSDRNDKSLPESSQIAEKYSIAPFPRRVSSTGNGKSTDSTEHTRSCLGGWQMGINRYSKNKDAAWSFIQWMLSQEAQQYLAFNEGFPVTLKRVYQDPYINEQNRHYGELLPIIENAQMRPLLFHYNPDVTDAVQDCVYRTLIDDTYPPEQAVQDLEARLQAILQKESKL